MIPPFNDAGCLPPGIFPATLDEIEARFGRASEVRRVQMESIRWMVDIARRAGVRRIVLNGSFVTDIIEPNDVDCVLLFADDYPIEADAAEALERGLPFLELKVVERPEFDEYVKDIFGIDRYGKVKGTIEVALWT